MPLPDRFRDLEQLIGEAMDDALVDARRSLATEVRRRTTEFADDARRRTLEDLHSGFRRLDGASGQSELLSALLEEAGRFASRTALLITFEDRARGWGAYGFPQADSIAETEIDYQGPWAELARGAGCVSVDSNACAALCAPLGGEEPAEGILIPLVLRDRVAAALYADRTGDDESFEPTALRLLVLEAAQALELQALRQRTQTPTLFESREEETGLPLWPTGGEVSEARAAARGPESEAGASEGSPATAEVAVERGAIEPPQRVEETPPFAATESAAAWGSPEGTWSGSAARAETAGNRDALEAQVEPPAGETPSPAAETGATPEVDGDDDALESGAPQESDERASEAPTAPPSGEEEEDLELEPTTAMPRTEPGSDTTVRLSREALGQQGSTVQEDGPAEETAESHAIPDQQSEEEISTERPPAAPESASAASGGSRSTEVSPPPDLEGPGWAFRDQESATDQGPTRDPEQAALHEEARRLARLLVSEIKLYNEEQVEQGRRHRDLYARLQEDIDRSRQMYEERVDPGVRQETDYFQQEMVNILAGGDAEALGL